MKTRLALLLLSTSLASGVVAQPAAGPGSRRATAVPQIDWGWEMLPVREFAQRQTLDRFEVFYDFQFRDAQPESGITFQNQITPDSAIFYQPNHYDHGNGIAVADVDGDELFDIYFVTSWGQRALEEPRERPLREHHRDGRRRSRRPARRLRFVRGHRQRRRP